MDPPDGEYVTETVIWSNIYGVLVRGSSLARGATLFGFSSHDKSIEVGLVHVH
jgi:hypothetical protein